VKPQVDVSQYESPFFKDLKNKLLLDNQSTAAVFCNPKFVKNIRTVDEKLELHTNGGALICDQKADLIGYPEPVWFSEKAITNIIPFYKVEESEQYAVEYCKEKGFKVTNLLTGNITNFTRDGGLYTATPNKTK
jgi:hypothetical protein